MFQQHSTTIWQTQMRKDIYIYISLLFGKFEVQYQDDGQYKNNDYGCNNPFVLVHPSWHVG